MNKINPLTAVTPVGSSTSRSGGQPPNHHHPSPRKILHATVIEEKADKSYILDLGGKRVQARGYNIELSPGQKLQLQVLSTSPRVELKIISDTLQQYLGRSLTLIGKNIDISSLLESLQQTPAPGYSQLNGSSRLLLEDFTRFQQESLSGKDGGKALEQLIKNLGLTLERHLAQGRIDTVNSSLKAVLLEISYLFKDAEKISEQTNQLLTTLELYQLAQIRMQHDNLFIFPLPLPFLDQGYLMVKYYQQENDDKDDEEQTKLNFSLHLTLEPLGHVRVNFLQLQDGIHLRFDMDSEEKVDFIKSTVSELKEQMAEHDMPLVGLNFTATAIAPATELISHLLPEGESMLDTKA